MRSLDGEGDDLHEQAEEPQEFVVVVAGGTRGRGNMLKADRLAVTSEEGGLGRGKSEGADIVS